MVFLMIFSKRLRARSLSRYYLAMRKLLLLPFLFLLLPASASAYTFETERMEEFRDEVREINRDRNSATSKAEKAALVSAISASASETKATFAPVRNAEIARLDKVLADRLAKVRTDATKKKTAMISSLNKQCTRQKRNKSEAQKKAIEARCKKRREAISKSMDTKLQRQEADIQKRFGEGSQPREILESKYNRALSTVDELLQESIESIGDRPAPTYLLSVSLAGTGEGSVLSEPTGVNCGSDCSGSYSEDTVVALTASPEEGSQFAGWSGVSCSTAPTCSVTMSEARSVVATFNTIAPS